ncbi:hypothetical protein QTP88_020428 [Uroleucon formosanum]
MESSESPDSKNVTTVSHDQASFSGNDQAIAAQHGNIDEQQLGSDAAMNQPCSSQPSPSNEIANVPNDNVNQQHQQPLNNDLHPQPPINERQQNSPNDNVNQQHQQPLNNDLHPQPPINERQQNGPNDNVNQQHQQPLNNDLHPQPPINERQQNGPNDQPLQLRLRVPPRGRFVFRKRIPHFHFTFGNRNWTYNDMSQRVSVREHLQPPIRRRRRPQVNTCCRLTMNERQPQPLQHYYNEQNQVPLTPPPLISRREIEPGIFEEIYSHNNYWSNRHIMLGVERCLCENFVNYNQGNDEMITVIMNNPSLTLRLSMTMSREAQFQDLFDAFYGLSLERPRLTFFACGRRLNRGDTPRAIGMNDYENIYSFVNSTRGYINSKKTTDDSK